MSEVNRNAEKKYYGLDKDAQAAIAAKWNDEDAKVALDWIAELSGMTLESDFHAALKSGVALCKAMNTLSPGAVANINTMKQPFMQRENILAFTKAAQKYGVRGTDVFDTQDLFEGQNLLAVLECIFALGSQAQKNKFAGRAIGVRPSQESATKGKFVVKPTGDPGAVSQQNLGSRDRMKEGNPDAMFKNYYRG